MNQQRTPNPELPALSAGVSLLAPDSRTTGALQTLVLDHLLTEGGTARWVDSHGQATTTSLARLAPSGRLLDRIGVARAFTAYQHFSLIETLETHLSARAGDAAEGAANGTNAANGTDAADATRATGADVSLVVVPALDWHYRADDLSDTQAEAMLTATVDRLADIADAHDVPVLVTRECADALTQPLERAATTTIECESTRFGPRFVADEFETLVYPMANGTVQTTLAFWERVLAGRAAQILETPTEPELPEVSEVSTVGAY